MKWWWIRPWALQKAFKRFRISNFNEFSALKVSNNFKRIYTLLHYYDTCTRSAIVVQLTKETENKMWPHVVSLLQTVWRTIFVQIVDSNWQKVLLHHNEQAAVRGWGFQWLKYPSYGLDLATSGYYLFPHLEELATMCIYFWGR